MPDKKKRTDEETAYDDAADVHDQDNKRHSRAAGHWAREEDAEKVALENRDAAVDNDAAVVDRDRARLTRKREDG